MKILINLLFVSIMACFIVLGVLCYKQSQVHVVPNNKLGSIVRLIVNEVTFCSGVVVAPNVVLTAAHCVTKQGPSGYEEMDKEPVEIRPADNSSVKAYGIVSFVQLRLDQAILIGNFDAFYARPALFDVKQLMEAITQSKKLTVCGYPLEGPLFCGEVVFQGQDGFMWAVEGLLLPGMSGGPVMLPDGTVVALNNSVADTYSVVSPIFNLNVHFPK